MKVIDMMAVIEITIEEYIAALVATVKLGLKHESYQPCCTAR